jgi:hypothetical protein
MAQICIPTPPLNEIRTVDVQVTIDGRARHAQYRVETLHWPPEARERLAMLQSFIAERREEWLLVQIGSPSEDRVPILFRLRSSEPGSASHSIEK